MNSAHRAVRLIAAVEAGKGVIVMMAGVGAFSLLHHNVQVLAEELVRHSHLNPASHYPQILIEAAGKLHDSELRILAIGASAYALLRFVEAYGLWRERVWAEWFAAASGGIYLPIEIYELSRGVTWIKVMLVMINALVVYYMVRLLVLRRSRR